MIYTGTDDNATTKLAARAGYTLRGGKLCKTQMHVLRSAPATVPTAFTFFA